MEDSLILTGLISATVAIGIGVQVLAKYLQIPSIVFLLLSGIAFGSSGLGLIEPARLGSGLEVIVSLAISLILFDGGFNLQVRELSGVSVSLRNLITIGVLITLTGAAIAAHGLSDFPWPLAVLYGALVVVTGPTVVTPLLKLVGVEPRVATLLEGEGILIDPIGAILAVIILNVVLSGNVEPIIFLKGLVLRLGIGIVIGLGAGGLLSLLLKQSDVLPQELKNLVMLATVWGAFSLAQALRSESGLMVAVVTGIVLRAARVPEERLLRQFNEQLGILANSVLFILLAADLSIVSLFDLGWESVLAVLVLMLVVRPLNIWVSTWQQGWNWRQQCFLAWVAPRGIVAASMASLFAISLTKQGMNGGDALKALVFLTIFITVFVQGLTARWVANWLGLRANQSRTVIVGDHPLARLLVRLLRQKGVAIALIDLVPTTTSPPQLDEIPTLSRYLNLEELEAEGVALFSTFLALTNNPELNGILAQQALELLRPDTIAILSQPPLSSGEGLAASSIQIAFAAQVALDEWNQALAQDTVNVVELVLQAPTLEAQRLELAALIAMGQFLPLLIESNQGIRIVLAGEVWQAGDHLTGLLANPATDKINYEPVILSPIAADPATSNLKQ